MSGQPTDPPPPQPTIRPVGGTELSWCRAVPTGTGITVLALLLSKPPDLSLLQTSLRTLQTTHPILRSRLLLHPTTHSFSLHLPPGPPPLPPIQPFDLPSTAQILRAVPNPDNKLSPFHLILEHEMNQNPWQDGATGSVTDDVTFDVFFATVYRLSEGEWAVTLRLHTGVCDRTGAAAVLRELVGTIAGGHSGGVGREIEGEGEVNLGNSVEQCIPSGKASKPFWARGVDMLGYSLNSFRFSNLDFVEPGLPRCSLFVRLQMGADETGRVLSGCKSRGIGLCGALAAAGLIAARSSKNLPDDFWEKYAVVTLVDCRQILDPVLSNHDIGFYHSAILNTHDINGEEKLWDLAHRTYTAFSNAKNNNKHFSDMADINFLMCRAIENPGLTPSSSFRTSFISVFEEPVIDHSSETHVELGVRDYIGCASVHGVGPSIALFHTIRDGELDCACVYPSPLHSREQMEELVENMKKILVDACPSVDGHAS